MFSNYDSSQLAEPISNIFIETVYKNNEAYANYLFIAAYKRL